MNILRSLCYIPIKPKDLRKNLKVVLKQQLGNKENVCKMLDWTLEKLEYELGPDTPERLSCDEEKYNQGIQKCVDLNPWMPESEIRKRLGAYND